VSEATPLLELRRVTIARYQANAVDLSSGLAAGEEIVSHGVHSVTAGTAVRTTPDNIDLARS